MLPGWALRAWVRSISAAPYAAMPTDLTAHGERAQVVMALRRRPAKAQPQRGTQRREGDHEGRARPGRGADGEALDDCHREQCIVRERNRHAAGITTISAATTVRGEDRDAEADDHQRGRS